MLQELTMGVAILCNGMVTSCLLEEEKYEEQVIAAQEKIDPPTFHDRKGKNPEHKETYKKKSWLPNVLYSEMESAITTYNYDLVSHLIKNMKSQLEEEKVKEFLQGTDMFFRNFLYDPHSSLQAKK
jgi:hypothetical protein